MLIWARVEEWLLRSVGIVGTNCSSWLSSSQPNNLPPNTHRSALCYLPTHSPPSHTHFSASLSSFHPAIVPPPAIFPPAGELKAMQEGGREVTPPTRPATNQNGRYDVSAQSSQPLMTSFSPYQHCRQLEPAFHFPFNFCPRFLPPPFEIFSRFFRDSFEILLRLLRDCFEIPTSIPVEKCRASSGGDLFHFWWLYRTARCHSNQCPRQ